MEFPERYFLSIGQVLRYPRAQEDPPAYMDGCLNFRWLGAYENAGGFQLESGINTPAAVKGSDGVTRRPAIIISSSPHKKGTAETPWQDFFDVDNGHIRYFGDNKDPGKDPAQAPGNKALLTAFRLSHSHEKADRALTPPLLFFRRVTHQGRSKGFPAFQGFGVVRSVELITQWDNRNQRSFTNYAFDFTVFNLESESEKFDWTWINARRNPGLSLAETHSFAPKSWKSWIANGSNYLERARRRVSRLRVEKRDEQRPAPHSEASSVLAEIYEHYNDKKHKFEALAEDISCRVVGAEGGHYKKGWITPPGSDGGSDFIASIKLGSDFSSAQIVVLGQAKCVRLDSPTHGNHIARTVARLKRGWIGVFVTTSYFSESVQQEVIEDRYPIVLIHGRRLAEEVAKVVHDNEQFRTVTDYLDTLDSQYELRIQQRQPEEVLY